MTTTDRFDTLELQEFQLAVPDTSGRVARLVAASQRGREPVIPLLTSIERQRDVALVRGVPGAGDAGPDVRTLLGPFVTRWADLKHYHLRIAERSQSPPGYYRLAVTESGIDNARSDRAPSSVAAAAPASAAPAGLLWIGAPIGTHAGLLVLLGETKGEARADPHTWPLPLSRALGVRIYEGQAALPE